MITLGLGGLDRFSKAMAVTERFYSRSVTAEDPSEYPRARAGEEEQGVDVDPALVWSDPDAGLVGAARSIFAGMLAAEGTVLVTDGPTLGMEG